MVYHSTEFYYTYPDWIDETTIILNEEESNHAIKVMRHSPGDKLNVTDGEGNVYGAFILESDKKRALLQIESKSVQKNRFKNVTFYIPILKYNERLETAIEKSVELGITNFVIYFSENSQKRVIKLERWNKIALSAMKQSLNAYKPNIRYCESLSLISGREDLFIIFDQLATEKFALSKYEKSQPINFLFGPEAGLTKNEIEKVSNKKFFFLTKTRLRAETAVIAAAVLISTA